MRIILSTEQAEEIAAVIAAARVHHQAGNRGKVEIDIPAGAIVVVTQ